MKRDKFATGPARPPYFACGAPSTFCDPSDAMDYPDAYIPLCSCGEDEALEMLPLLRGLAWRAAANEAGVCVEQPWFLDAVAILETGYGTVMLLSKMLDALDLTEHGSSHRWPWLTDAGWRALWAYELRLEMVAEEEETAA